MRKFIALALCATSLLAGTAEAQHRDHDGRDRFEERHRPGHDQRAVGRNDRRPGVAYRSWRRGERFDQRYARNYQVIDYRRYRGLRAPPRGYRYVRSGNDAVLIAAATGIVAAVIANAVQ